jgi:predicted GNAT family N-acyltransferase
MTPTITLTDDIGACQALRRTVFIEEQGVSVADEVDGKDAEARHLIAVADGHPVGTARLLTDGTTGKVGRVCVLAKFRGQGIGAALVRAAVEVFRADPDLSFALLGAQTHAISFYQRLGFRATGPVYEDAGIPHRDMILALRG